MIKNIAAGQGLTVSNVGTSWPYFSSYAGNNNPSTGIVRYDGQTQALQVHDGSMWHNLPTSTPLVELSYDVHELLKWAKKKRDEEYNLKELVEKHPTLEAAKQQLDKAKEQMDILVALVTGDKA